MQPTSTRVPSGRWVFATFDLSGLCALNRSPRPAALVRPAALARPAAFVTAALVAVALASTNAYPSTAQATASPSQNSPAAAAPIAADGSTPPPAAFTDAEIADVAAVYLAASEEEQALLKAFYLDMGIDLASLLEGITGPPSPTSAPTAAVPAATGESALMKAVKAVNFTRTPQAVLAARSKLGFTAAPDPDRANPPAVATWLHLQVMGGEWERFASFLAAIDPTDAAGIYAHVLQSINKPPRPEPGAKADPALLPEEVLAIADAAPAELSDWQFDVLSQLLRTASTKYSTAPMLEQLAAGTRLFGKTDEATRARTVRFLVGAGQVVDAYAYFPPLDDARARNDAKALLNHARHQQELAADPRGTFDRDELLRSAWSLFGEVTLLPEAEAKVRQDALRRAIDLLPSVPPAQASAWIKEVFASPSLAPAALEVMALKAVSLRNARLDVAQRAQIILTMKESVDTLLAQSGVDIRLLRVPLRMLTSALITEAENALAGGAMQDGNEDPEMAMAMAMGMNRARGPGAPAETQLLLRALPDERWLAALEPSLASRAYHAAIGIATSADEVDVALDYLAQAVRRFPGQGMLFADRFLQRWEQRMAQPPRFDDEMYFIGFVQNSMPAAPLTRGRQRRNLERLARLMGVLDAIGVDSRRLPSVASVFKATHGRTEVFDRAGVERVFGPLEQLPPETAASLADQMRSGLSGDWRDRRAQQAAGMKRSAAEVTALVEQGYALALELIDRATAAEPDSWRYAVTKAGLAFDRVQFKQSEEKQDFATYNQYRKEAFAAFARTAEVYAELVRKGDQRDDPGVYLAWFNAAVGATELNYLTRDDLLVEGSPQDDQIDLIRKALQSLPPDAADRHLGGFASAIEGSLPQVTPDVKPRVVRHALRVVGDHPGGAALRRLADLYQDLVKDEIKLRLAVDGEDRVGADRRFGATLVLRFTTAVDRETGGFSRYLQNDVWARVGNSYRPTNYRDQLKKDIEAAMRDRFDVEGLGFFEALAPPRPVKEGGEDGWLEKPLVYLVLKARDPSVDRLPALSMDLVFNDSLGPVTLPIASNSPPIDAASPPSVRPVKALDVEQILDLRDMHSREKNYAITLEIQAKGEGVVPELDELLPSFRSALPGYEVAATGVEVRPTGIVENDADASARQWFSRSPQRTATEYAAPDEDGTYRLTSERSWLVTYTPSGGPIGAEFVLPTLNPAFGVAERPSPHAKPDAVESASGTVKDAAPGGPGPRRAPQMMARQYADMDVVEIAGSAVAVRRAPWSWWGVAIAAAIGTGLAIAGAVAWRRRRPTLATDSGVTLPTRITPLSVVATLRRIERERGAELLPTQRESLERDIAAVESRFFGRASEPAEPGPREIDSAERGTLTGGELRGLLERWSAVAAS
jgi:hypothetical protein